MIWLIKISGRELWLVRHADGTITAHPSLKHAEGAIGSETGRCRRVEAQRSGDRTWTIADEGDDLLIRETDEGFEIEETLPSPAGP